MVRRRTNAEFVEEVKSLVGDEYKFFGEYRNSKTKIKVIHNKCGHQYEVRPYAFINHGSRCPKCAVNEVTKLITKTDEEFKKEVFEEVGTEYTFLGKYVNNYSKMRVIHNECGHTYEVKPSAFIYGGSRCPKCAAESITKTDEEFKKEVFEEVGTEYTFLEEYNKSQSKIKVVHNKCGHVYKVTPKNFINLGRRCPKCATSKGEKAIERFLLKHSVRFVPQHPIKYTENKIPLRADFYAEGVLIEYDGRQHFEPIEAWGGERALRETQRRDRIKNEYCAKHGIPMIRIPYWDFERIDEILTDKLLPIIRKKDDKLA